jgi:hypothetical protein
MARDYQHGIEMAWHKLTKVKPVLHRDECFPDFIRQPLYVQNADGQFIPYLENGVDAWTVPQADDDFLATCPIPDTYRLFTPREAWDKITGLLSGSKFTVSSAGTIQNRAKWFVSVELDELKEVSKGMPDYHKFCLNFFGGLDRSLSPVCNLSAIRPVCGNTVRANLNDKSSYLFTARLTQGFDAKMTKAEPEIEKAVGMAEVFRRTIENLGNTKSTEQEARNVYAGFLGERGFSFAEKKGRTGNITTARAFSVVDEMAGLFENGLGNKGRSRLDVLNGATEYWTRGAKETTKSVWSQFETSEFGRMAEFKSDFFSVVKDDGAFNQLADKGKVLLAS